MSHDELLAKIDGLDEHWNLTHPQLKAWQILRAVVELHHKFEPSNYCNACDGEYPCPTIQAIEKELS